MSREENLDEEAPIKIPIDGILDLHTFAPREVKDLIDDYLLECLEAGLSDIRIIHGKGKGILRDRVYSILKRHSLVESYIQAPPEAGGWGAVLVKLKTPPRCESARSRGDVGLPLRGVKRPSNPGVGAHGDAPSGFPFPRE